MGFFTELMMALFSSNAKKTTQDENVSGNSKSTPGRAQPQRLVVDDVKPGEYIYISWYRASPNVCQLLCVANDPARKKILLQVKWRNYKEQKINEIERIIFDYDSSALKDFHLLNYERIEEKNESDEIDDNDIAGLQSKMNAALQREDYRLADQLQKRIDKIVGNNLE